MDILLQLHLALVVTSSQVSPQVFNSQDIAQTVVTLRAETQRDGRQIPLDKIDYSSLERKLRDVEPILRGKADLWTVTPLPDLSSIPDALLYSAVHEAYGFAPTLAPNRQSKVHWWRADWALTMQMIRDERTKRQYELWRRNEDDPNLHLAVKLPSTISPLDIFLESE